MKQTQSTAKRGRQSPLVPLDRSRLAGGLYSRVRGRPTPRDCPSDTHWLNLSTDRKAKGVDALNSEYQSGKTDYSPHPDPGEKVDKDSGHDIQKLAEQAEEVDKIARALGPYMKSAAYERRVYVGNVRPQAVFPQRRHAETDRRIVAHPIDSSQSHIRCVRKIREDHLPADQLHVWGPCFN